MKKLNKNCRIKSCSCRAKKLLHGVSLCRKHYNELSHFYEEMKLPEPLHMTNQEKWMAYCDGLTSPLNYLQWAWRYTIAASLQRRVWLPPEHQRCYANMYCIFVGRAGLGKGLPIREVSKFLKHWKLKDAILYNKETLTLQQKETVETLDEINRKRAEETSIGSSNKKAPPGDSLLIPVAADATTYEAFVKAVAEAFRYVNYITTDNNGRPKLGNYGHSSICFTLQELASLLRKRTNDTVNYMLGLYDCPDVYEYDTKTQGKDRVTRGCLNLLAGTTPNFMQEIFNEKLIDQGFASRTFFIYANKDRKTQFWIPELNEEQKTYEKDLLEHLRKLTTLYGAIRMSSEVKDFLESWWKENHDKRSNISEKLDGYYARRKVHIMKVAMAEHFSESFELEIPLATYEKAIKILEKEEMNMHLALMLEGDNKENSVAFKILDMLRTGQKNWVDVFTACYHMGDKSSIEQAISFLLETNQIARVEEKDKDTEETVMWFRVKGNTND